VNKQWRVAVVVAVADDCSLMCYVFMLLYMCSSAVMNPWCQLCQSLVRVADADTACREILQVFDRLQEDEGSWTAEVSIATAYCFLLPKLTAAVCMSGRFCTFYIPKDARSVVIK